MSDERRVVFGAADVAEAYRTRLEPVIFRPWAELLLDFADVQAGQRVLDVACGTGVVARAAATRVGPNGSVIASDISAAMLAHVVQGADAGGPIETLECSATELKVADASVDLVVCQQGLQFFPDQPAALKEMHRVLRPGGRIGFAVWLAEVRLHPFGIYGDALQATGVDEPFPGAFQQDNFTMSLNRALDLLELAGFKGAQVDIMDLELAWSGPEAAAQAIFGTPFGPVISAFPSDRQEAFMASLTAEFTDDDGKVAEPVMSAVLGGGTK
jgi:SAM-dependent methyltransferase